MSVRNIIKNKTAIVTGATSGIGAEYARMYAYLGYNLLITGRREQKLKVFSEKLKRTYNISVKYTISDFSIDSSLDLFFTELENLDYIAVLVNNAGFGSHESFIESDYIWHEKMIKVHINAVTKATYIAIPKMIANGGGTIINVSSFAAFTPLASGILYNSTKAFLVSFSESLHLYLNKYDIKVQVLCPGFIHTDFHDRFGIKGETIKAKPFLRWMSPEFVVSESLRAIDSNKSVIYVPGIYYKFSLAIIRIIPKVLYYRMINILDR